MELHLPPVEDINHNFRYIIGIDPDTEASGIALWCIERNEYLAYTRTRFFDIYDYFDQLLSRGIRFEVAIEAGWRNPSIMHHVSPLASLNKAASIGANVGANHETGRKLVEMCEWFGIKHWLLTPTSSKWTPTMLKHLTGITLAKSQQDIIDAMRLVYHFKQPAV